nr:FlgD immunoglobulin-like domain containing protein [Candidatus Krumholzibacteria bacterium]
STVDDLPGARGLALTVFPNPFNPETRVAFELPRGGYVNLAVYDLTGRLVRKLADGLFVAGRHEMTWNGRNSQGLHAGSGVYLMRLVTPDGATSMRATLLK